MDFCALYAPSPLYCARVRGMETHAWLYLDSPILAKAIHEMGKRARELMAPDSQEDIELIRVYPQSAAIYAFNQSCDDADSLFKIGRIKPRGASYRSIRVYRMLRMSARDLLEAWRHD